MRWAYEITNARIDDADLEVVLADFGIAGWELAAAVPHTDGTMLLLVFKRPDP